MAKSTGGAGGAPDSKMTRLKLPNLVFNVAKSNAYSRASLDSKRVFTYVEITTITNMNINPIKLDFIYFNTIVT